MLNSQWTRSQRQTCAAQKKLSTNRVEAIFSRDDVVFRELCKNH